MPTCLLVPAVKDFAEVLTARLGVVGSLYGKESCNSELSYRAPSKNSCVRLMTGLSVPTIDTISGMKALYRKRVGYYPSLSSLCSSAKRACLPTVPEVGKKALFALSADTDASSIAMELPEAFSFRREKKPIAPRSVRQSDFTTLCDLIEDPQNCSAVSYATSHGR